jgi:hypothetical protein
LAAQKLDIAGLKKDPKKMAAFFTFAKREKAEDLLLFLFDASKPEVLYAKYLAPKAKNEINLSAALMKEIRGLGDDPKNPLFTKLISLAKLDVAKLTTSQLIPKFQKSKEYEVFLEQESPAIKIDPAKASVLIGSKNTAKIKAILETCVKGDLKKGEALLKDLLAAEKLTKKPTDVLIALKKAKLI